MYLYHSLLLTRRANMSTLQQAITLSLFGYFFLNFATCGETNKMDTDILRQMLNQETIMRMAMETEVKGLKKELKVIRRITENFHDKCSKLMSKKGEKLINAERITPRSVLLLVYKYEVQYVLSLDNNILVFGACICMIWFFFFICDYMCSCSKWIYTLIQNHIQKGQLGFTKRRSHTIY